MLLCFDFVLLRAPFSSDSVSADEVQSGEIFKYLKDCKVCRIIRYTIPYDGTAQKLSTAVYRKYPWYSLSHRTCYVYWLTYVLALMYIPHSDMYLLGTQSREKAPVPWQPFATVKNPSSMGGISTFQCTQRYDA